MAAYSETLAEYKEPEARLEDPDQTGWRSDRAASLATFVSDSMSYISFSIYNIYSDVFVHRHQATVDRWVKKVERQSTVGTDPGHIEADKTVIQLDTERY